MTETTKILVLTASIVVAVAVFIFAALMLDWHKSSANAEEDILLSQVRSSDQRLVAEVHLSTTAMHGGPDKLYISIGTAYLGPDKIYERTYECADLSAFRLQWDGPHQLRVIYGECDPAHEESTGNYGNFYKQEQNRVWRQDTTWQDVNIVYSDSNYVANH